MLLIAWLPENLPTPTNGIVIFVVLCLLVFGSMRLRSSWSCANGSGFEAFTLLFDLDLEDGAHDPRLMGVR
jgi:hypothetical protein